MATYVNDLRLKEIGTGESSGTWGTETNVNLELIGEALSFGTAGLNVITGCVLASFRLVHFPCTTRLVR